MKKAATIKDIAHELGISTSTVSRALAGHDNVNPLTREQVQEVARRLNYRPNPIALRLLNNRTKVIGIVVPEFQNSFFPRVIIGVQDVLEREGYELLITQSGESHLKEEKNLRLLQNSRVEGIIISVTKDNRNAELYRELIESGIPLVFFNRICPGIDASKVIIDDYEMAQATVEHLILSGCRRIAHLAGPDSLELTEKRKKGYFDALQKYGLEADSSLIVTSGVSSETGYDGMSWLLDKGVGPDAVFAFCDPVAIGAMKAIKERGLKIPDDISIAGFSESQSAVLVEPNLTTVAQPLQQMGVTAAEILLEEINDILAERPAVHREVRLPAELIIRKSSCRSGSGHS